ncbi:unnamed protein product [Agarophyton chilense]
MLELRPNNEGVVHLEDSGERHPFSVVWTTLPLISWIVPIVGHMGIADSRGVVYDFSGPFQVTVGSFMCGPAKRQWSLNVNEIHANINSTSNSGHCDEVQSSAKAYDEAVIDASKTYGKRMHNIFCDNCHSHVAKVLNLLQYEGSSNWNQAYVFWRIWTRGKWTSKWQPAIVFGPLLVIVVVVGLLAGLT